MSTNGTGRGHEEYEEPSEEEKVTVPLDYSGTWWANAKNDTNAGFGRFSKEDMDRYWVLHETKFWGDYLKNCQKRRRELLKYSTGSHTCAHHHADRWNEIGPIIRFMTDKIGQMGGNITEDSFPCNRCSDEKGSGFHPVYGLEICANKLGGKSHQEHAMAHGMRLF